MVWIWSGRETGYLTMVREIMRLRLEAESGLATQEYRVTEETVEVRSLHTGNGYAPPLLDAWRQVTTQQLRTHVERNTVVAQWLERRIGWRRLLQACVGQEMYPRRLVEDCVEENREAA
jgi:hypothetical protein